jgi:ketosteroid isomerase-like protein
MPLHRAEIMKLENQLMDAIKTSDIVFLKKVLHDDLLFLAPDGQVVTKDIDLASHLAGEMEVEELIAIMENVHVIADTAVVVVVYDTKGTMLGEPIQGQYRYIRIWKEFPDGPKVIGGSCCKL